MKIEQLHQLFLKHPVVSTDTRNIKKNSLFFSLKGPKFNGNSFAAEAIKKGATYAIIDEPQYQKENSTILVDNVLESLQKLGTFHRKSCKAKVISLTGSNGKTTTKELIATVLSKKYSTIATKGNLNNHIGVPLTLLSITDNTEMAVVEMGANHQKEIELLSSISQPDYGYITNFGKAHLEGFGGVEGVIKGKSELYDYLIANDKHIFLNADDPIQKEKLAAYIKKIGFSQIDTKFFNIKLIDAKSYVRIQFEDTIIQTQLTGSYNFPNCAVAILLGKYFNIDTKEIKEALEAYIPQNNRSQIIERAGHKIILDAYNANPTSMKVALESFAKDETESKYLFLGDMFELGEAAEREHQNIAKLSEDLGFKNICLVGENFNKVKSPFQKFNSFEALESNFDFKSLSNAQILIKGSRGMAMERILALL